MARLALTPRFAKKYARVREATLKRQIETALVQFVEDELHPGLGFEAIVNQDGFHSIRAGRKWRIKLREALDDEGIYYEAITFGSHDDVYRR